MSKNKHNVHYEHSSTEDIVDNIVEENETVELETTAEVIDDAAKEVVDAEQEILEDIITEDTNTVNIAVIDEENVTAVKTVVESSLRSKIEYLEYMLSKTKNEVQKGEIYEKLKLLRAKLNNIYGSAPMEAKTVEAAKISERKDKVSRDNVFATRGQVVGVEGMFITF